MNHQERWKWQEEPLPNEEVSLLDQRLPLAEPLNKEDETSNAIQGGATTRAGGAVVGSGVADTGGGAATTGQG